jgi:hypothetical protein
MSTGKSDRENRASLILNSSRCGWISAKYCVGIEVGAEEVAGADRADRLERPDRVLQMQHQAAADDDVEAADLLGREVVDGELAALDLGAEQLLRDLEAAAGLGRAAARHRRRP